MGQKVHPGGLRVGVIHDWKSNWYTGKKEFPEYLLEDIRIREHIYKKLSHAGLSDILIRKDKQRITIDIYTARPGIVIGKSGVEVDALRRELHAMTQKNVHININEIKRPELDAKLVAQSIAEQLQNRVSFRRAMKRALASAMRSGAARREDRLRRPARRRRDEPLRDLLGGPRPAAHDPRRHRLRLRRGEDDLRPHRREGLDQQGRDHARGLRGHERRQATRGSATRIRPAGAAARARVSAPRREGGRGRGQDREGLGPVRQRRGGAGAAVAGPAVSAAAAVGVPAAAAVAAAVAAPAARGGGPRPGGGGGDRARGQSNVERPRTDEQARSAEGRQQPPVEPQVEQTPKPVDQAPDTTTPKTMHEEPQKLDSSGDEGKK